MGSLDNPLLPEPSATVDHSEDVLYEIAKSDVVGRYMVAARDIHPGEIIFTDQPACIGPDNGCKPMCLGCYRKLRDGSYLCPGCQWPMCGPACTKLPDHRTECSVFKARKAVVVIPSNYYDKPCSYYDAILPIRVLLLKISNPKIYRLVSLLMDHNDCLEESTQKYRQRVVDFIRKTCKLAEDFTEQEVHHVLGILSVNSFVVHDTSEDHLDLIGLYPWTSLMSHYCTANTNISTREDFSYVCKAATFISAGTEIVTSYHHYHYHFYGTVYRRQDLKNTWNFDCMCPRCLDPTEFGTMVSAVVCEKCKFGNVLPGASNDLESQWICDDCGAKFAAKDIAEKIQKFEDDIDNTKSDDAPEFEKLLRKMRYFLHENHYWILEVKRKLIDIYGNKPGYELFKLPKETLEKKIEYCNHLLEVAAKLCPGASEMRGYLLWELHGASLRLTQWKWIRMRISTTQYWQRVMHLSEVLEEIITIFGNIRKDADEGRIAIKAREELKQLESLATDLKRQTISSSPVSALLNKSKLQNVIPTTPLSRKLENRRSICL